MNHGVPSGPAFARRRIKTSAVASLKHSIYAQPEDATQYCCLGPWKMVKEPCQRMVVLRLELPTSTVSLPCLGTGSARGPFGAIAASAGFWVRLESFCGTRYDGTMRAQSTYSLSFAKVSNVGRRLPWPFVNAPPVPAMESSSARQVLHVLPFRE
jgi:hypothetical protein